MFLRWKFCGDLTQRDRKTTGCRLIVKLGSFPFKQTLGRYKLPLFIFKSIKTWALSFTCIENHKVRQTRFNGGVRDIWRSTYKYIRYCIAFLKQMVLSDVFPRRSLISFSREALYLKRPTTGLVKTLLYYLTLYVCEIVHAS